MKEKPLILNIGKYIFLHFLILRLISVWVVQTWYVPDEYWQSLEVAHHYVFGYGYLTWEWRYGLRSFVHPLIIAFIYKILAFFNLDTAHLLVISPRIAQSILSAYADYCLFKWSGRKKWAVFCITIQWFWFYTASRTLINTFETALTTIALSNFPWKGSINQIKSNDSFLWIVAFLVFVRPTAAIHWFPLCVYHIYLQKDNWIRIIATRYLFIGLIVFSLITAIDSFYYNQFIITQWQFLKLNVFAGIGNFYGTLPWHWYFTAGFPTILGVHILPFAWASFKDIQNRHIKQNQVVIIATILFSLTIYSILQHKEFRFILPLVPMALYITIDFLAPWSGKTSRLIVWLAAITLLTASIAPIYYLSYIHQRGALKVMPILQNIASTRPKDTSFLFLMPCHSTPLYSHLHVNVHTRFLTCEPNLKGVANYTDEADQFYENPVNWLTENYPTESNLPSHIITFDHLHSSSSIFKTYKKIHSIHHTDVPTDRVGQKIYIYQRESF